MSDTTYCRTCGTAGIHVCKGLVLKSPQGNPRTRDVTVFEFYEVGDDVSDWGTHIPIGAKTTGRSHTFSVPVDDKEGVR